VPQPLQPCNADDDRSRIEHCGIKAAKPQWDVQHPPQKTARAVRVHVMCTLLMVALATAYRLQWEQAALGGEPGGWQRWRRHRVEQTRAPVIVCAPGSYGILPLAEFAVLMGGKRKDMPPGLGTRQEILAKYSLPPER
jgi:hypothetical protein